MKYHKKLPMAVAAAAMLVLVSLTGCASEEPQATLPGGMTIPAEGTLVDMRGMAMTAGEFESLAAQLPEHEIIWSVPLSGGSCSSEETQLVMNGLTAEDIMLLRYLPELKSIEITNCEDMQLITQLREAYPQLEINHTITLGGTDYAGSMDALALTDPDCDELLQKLECFTQLQTVTLDGKLPEKEKLLALKETYPAVTFVWDFEIFGIPVNTLTEFVDLSGIEMESTEEVEAWLPYFYNLKQVDMVNCGISNEEMEELNLRNEGTKFVWSISLGGLRTVRTDITYFMPYLLDISVNNIMCQNLKYCHDVIFLDLGHMYVSDISFLEYMPKMQYLILADTLVKDVELIGQMQELKFLEVFLTDVEDISPLLNCSKLEDLNISLIGDIDCTPLYQMTWLDRLWVISSDLDYDEMQELNYALSNTMIVYNAKGCTLKGWRMGPNYYEMRDVVDLWYAIT